MSQRKRDLWWGLPSQFFPFRYFPNLAEQSEYRLFIWYNYHIWQMSLQLSCGDICQIWTWFEECNMYFLDIRNILDGEIWSISYPHPWSSLRKHSCCDLELMHPCFVYNFIYAALKLYHYTCINIPLCIYHNWCNISILWLKNQFWERWNNIDS